MIVAPRVTVQTGYTPHHLSGPHLSTPNPQAGAHCHHLGHYPYMPHQFAHQRQYPPIYPVNTYLPLTSASKLPAPTPVSIFKTVQHPHKISPTKPKFTRKKIPINLEIFQKNIQQAHCTCGDILQPKQGTDELPPTQTPAPPPACVFEMVHHPYGIGPAKPVIRVPWVDMSTSVHPTQSDRAVVKLMPLSHLTTPIQHCHRRLAPVSGICSIPLLQSFSSFISHFTSLPSPLPGQFLSCFTLS